MTTDDYDDVLLEVKVTEDIIQLYKHLQYMAIQRNIFVTEFDQLKFWDHSNEPPPPTCSLANISSMDNTELASKRIQSVLYQKISKASFFKLEHKELVLDHSIM